ncbi:MAG: hypothetical protein HC788_11080, partial [Sphingopyxis sp.]|nr:hypothetical protein [Sphingopyxis sp.]
MATVPLQMPILRAGSSLFARLEAQLEAERDRIGLWLPVDPTLNQFPADRDASSSDARWPRSSGDRQLGAHIERVIRVGDLVIHLTARERLLQTANRHERRTA